MGEAPEAIVLLGPPEEEFCGGSYCGQRSVVEVTTRNAETGESGVVKVSLCRAHGLEALAAYLTIAERHHPPEAQEHLPEWPEAEAS